ncbi:hypothetical protein [Kitasatospora purpeofusca]|uniref:hypothetical protein n=1 Tax=Kitasatospora purpeofusca TaxID=67352 RepID=UPI00386AB8C8|nr:hypothetical protein OIP63_02920 [Kitasatospora purpeofusca]
MHVRDMVAATVVAEIVGVLFACLLGLAVWTLLGEGWLRDLPWALSAVGAVGVAVEYDRKRPPRRLRGVLAGVAALGAVAVVAAAVADRVLPDAAGTGLIGAIALLLAVPVANGVLAAAAGRPAEG